MFLQLCLSIIHMNNFADATSYTNDFNPVLNIFLTRQPSKQLSTSTYGFKSLVNKIHLNYF